MPLFSEADNATRTIHSARHCVHSPIRMDNLPDHQATVLLTPMPRKISITLTWNPTKAWWEVKADGEVKPFGKIAGATAYIELIGTHALKEYLRTQDR